MANQLKMAMIEAIARLHARGWSGRRIAEELGINRETVARQLARAAESKPAKAPIGWAQSAADPKPAKAPIGSDDRQESGLEGLSVAAMSGSPGPPQSRSECEPWRAVILEKLELGLTAQRIFQDLVSDHAFTARYSSVRRFVDRLGRSRALPFRRMECQPGEETQIDFGTGAPIVTADGKRRRTHVFRFVLSHSRKGYSEAVYRQTTDDFIRCIENAFWQFGGVSKVLVIDNLKAAVKEADWYDPELTPKLQSFCAHYGVTILPTRPRMPRHKGKIERGIGYVKSNALKGRTFSSLEEQNRHLLQWEESVADKRLHGTTRRQVMRLFQDAERPALQALPVERFPCFQEGKRIVHRDGHIEVKGAYYSVPPEYLGHQVWARWDARMVRVFDSQMRQIATHPRRPEGKFNTQPGHIASEKVNSVERGAAWLLAKTAYLGASAARWGAAMTEARGVAGVRVLQGLLALAQRNSAESIDEACRIAAASGCYRLKTIRELLRRRTAAGEQLEFIQEHPLIRNLSEYADLVHTSFQKER